MRPSPSISALGFASGDTRLQGLILLILTSKPWYIYYFQWFSWFSVVILCFQWLYWWFSEMKTRRIGQPAKQFGGQTIPLLNQGNLLKQEETPRAKRRTLALMQMYTHARNCVRKRGGDKGAEPRKYVSAMKCVPD